MLSFIAMLLPPITIGALLVAVLIVVPRRRKLVAINADAFPGLARLRNVTLIARIIGIIVGIAAIGVVNNAGRLGLGILLSPAVFAATQILATLAAGLITHNSARTPGTAGLEVRRIRPYLPTALSALTISVAAVLTAVLVWSTTVASPDDLGRAGRNFSYTYPCDDAACGSGFGPFPGSYYSIPLAIVLAATLLIAVATIFVTVRRPRNASDPEILRVDDVVRSRSVESVIAAVGVATAGSLFAVSFLIGMPLALTGNEVPVGLHVLGVSAIVISGAALIMMSWCVVVLLLPGARAARTEAARGSAAAVASER